MLYKRPRLGGKVMQQHQPQAQTWSHGGVVQKSAAKVQTAQCDDQRQTLAVTQDPCHEGSMQTLLSHGKN